MVDQRQVCSKPSILSQPDIHINKINQSIRKQKPKSVLSLIIDPNKQSRRLSAKKKETDQLTWRMRLVQSSYVKP